MRHRSASQPAIHASVCLQGGDRDLHDESILEEMREKKKSPCVTAALAVASRFVGAEADGRAIGLSEECNPLHSNSQLWVCATG